MIRNRSCSLSAKVKWNFYDMIKIPLIMIKNVIIFTIHESLLQNVMNILPTIYLNKTKVLGEINKFRV